jgi:hypothetical protein
MRPIYLPSLIIWLFGVVLPVTVIVAVAVAQFNSVAAR